MRLKFEGVEMKYLIAAALTAISVASFADAASAAGGCGPGWHRAGGYGRCVPNRGAVVVRPGAVVVRPAPVVVVPRARVCPRGMFYRYGRCRY
jgi:hypothetical protein